MNGRMFRVTAIALLALAGVALIPAMSLAEQPVARVILYEVMESLNLSPARATDNVHGERRRGDEVAEAIRRRLADAALLGRDVVPFTLNSPFANAHYMTANATSSVVLDPTRGDFGTGPLQGTFKLAILVNDPSGQKHLSNLVETAVGTLRGTLDLRSALATPPMPVAPVEGKWRIGRAHPGRFTGVFLIPFELAGLPGQLFYLNHQSLESPGLPSICAAGRTIPTMNPSITLCPLTPDEHALGFPLTKAVIFLTD